MLDREVLSELQAIAVRGAEAADHGGREDELLGAYDALRARAATLARAHGLATPEQMADQFPSPRALLEIERLDAAFGPDRRSAIAPEHGMAARVSQGLMELSAWATGVRLAYETLEGDVGGDA
jgi:hypothetical protein